MWPKRKTEATHNHDVVRPPRSEWQLLAPIQRAIGDPPLVNPVQRFRDSLAAWQDPSFLAPLAHIVHADEPSGLIPELATATPAPEQPALPLAVSAEHRPPARAAIAQRMVASQPSAGATTPVPSGLVAPVLVAPVLVAPDLVTAGPGASGPGTDRATAVQRATAVDAGPVGRIEVPPTMTLPALRPSGSADTSMHPDLPSASADVTAGLLGDASADGGAGITVSRSDDAVTGPESAPSRSGSTPVGAELSLQRSVAGGLPHSGSSPSTPLGELPLSGSSRSGPSSPGSTRSTSTSATSATSTSATSTSATSTSATSTPAESTVMGQAWSGSPSSGSPQSGALLSGLPLSGSPRRLGLGEPLTGLPVQRSQSTPPPLVLPTSSAVGSTPPASIAPTLSAPTTAGSDQAAPPAGDDGGPTFTLAPDLPLLIAVQRTSEPGSGAGRPTLTLARLVGDARPLITPARSDAMSAGPGTHAPGYTEPPESGRPTMSLGRTTAQLTTESRTPPALVYGSTATPEARPAPVGVPISDLPIATASWVNPSIQRTESATVPAPMPVTVARAIDDPTPTDVPAAAADAGHPAAGAGSDPEAMVARLFDPLLSRLKTELRLDRERRGSLTDLWH
jgi:hypothetical protein